MTAYPSPLVSVVMAAKNYARFVPLAIGSVLRQTVTDWELVIVDDGSTDDTASAVQPYLADRRIRYVQSDQLGQSRAKNLGARLSRGAFIAYLDADDAWLPTKLAKRLLRRLRLSFATLNFSFIKRHHHRREHRLRVVRQMPTS